MARFASLLAAASAATAAAAAAAPVVISVSTTANFGTWRGWGTSLAWDAATPLG
jgi:hypothetical protein